MLNGGIMKQTVYSLNEVMKQLGREVNVDEIPEIVQEHAFVTAIGAAASGAIPGAGGVIALGTACTSTITMYGRLASVLGIRMSNGLLRAVASAVVADLAASAAASIAAAAAISFIPGVGNMGAATLTAITNYGFVYLAGLIFIRMIAAIGGNGGTAAMGGIADMSEEEICNKAKDVLHNMDIKKAMKEAREEYKERI